MDVVLDAEVEGLGVEDVGRVDDRRRRARDRVTGRHCAADLAPAHRVDQSAVAAKRSNTARFEQAFCGIAHMVKGRQIGKPLEDHGRIIDKRRRAELPGQVNDGDAGNVGSRGGKNSGHWRAMTARGEQKKPRRAGADTGPDEA